MADDRGEFATPGLIFEGGELSLNVETRQAGEVLVQIQDDSGQPIPGYSFADGDPVVVDSLDKRVTWRGNASLGEFAGKPISLSFRLRSAKLYAFEFVG